MTLAGTTGHETRLTIGETIDAMTEKEAAMTMIVVHPGERKAETVMTEEMSRAIESLTQRIRRDQLVRLLLQPTLKCTKSGHLRSL